MEGLGQEGLQLGGTGGVGVCGGMSRVIWEVSAGTAAVCQGATGHLRAASPRQ